MQELVATMGRFLGALSATVASFMWVFGMWMPSTQSVLSGWSFAVGFLMLMFSIFGVIASIRGHGNVMLAMFLGSFLPVGAFLLQSNHWLRWVGVANIGLLVAALATKWAAAQRPDVETPSPRSDVDDANESPQSGAKE
jgi:hypothetical protein